MTKKFYYLSTMLLLFLINSKAAFSQDMTVSASPSQGCAPLTSKLTVSHSMTQYFEWNIQGKTIIGKEVTYTFINQTNVDVVAYDTTGGKKEMLGARNLQLNLTDPVYISLSKDTLCRNADLQVSTGNFQLSTIDYGDGTIKKDPYLSHTYSQVGSYTIKIVGKNKCNQTFEFLKKVEVRNDVQPKPTFFTPYQSVCPGQPVSFSPASQSRSSKYVWNFGDGTTITDDNVKHSWAGPGTYKITLTETNSCGLSRTESKDILVFTKRNFTNTGVYISPKVACPNTKIRFSIYNESYKSIVLNYGDNTSSLPGDEDFEHIYTSAGKYYPKVTFTNFCNNDTTIFLGTITIENGLKWDNQEQLDVWIQDTICPGAPFRYGVYSRNAMSYAWDLEGGVTNNKSTGLHTYTTVGLHNVKVTLTNGCGIDTTISSKVVVSSNLAASNLDFESLMDSVCPGDTAIFIVDGEHLKDFKWNFGDGTTSTDNHELVFKERGSEYRIKYNKHTYRTAGEYNIMLEFSNFCGSKGVDSVKVFVRNNLEIDSDKYDFTYLDYPPTVCEPVRFFGYGAKSYLWDFGDGFPVTSYQNIIPHKFNTAGNYNVTLTLTNSCGNSGTLSDKVSVSGCLLDNQEELSNTDLFSVFPNPISTTATVKFGSIPSKPVNIYLVDAFGVRRALGNDFGLNDSAELILNVQALNLQEGIYILCIETDGKVTSEKISVIK